MMSAFAASFGADTRVYTPELDKLPAPVAALVREHLLNPNALECSQPDYCEVECCCEELAHGAHLLAREITEACRWLP